METQDKALRRISELREQCSLEQSAKVIFLFYHIYSLLLTIYNITINKQTLFIYFQAHLESALRVELDERNMKIESLNTKIKLLQDTVDVNKTTEVTTSKSEQQLIDLSEDQASETEDSKSEIILLTNKIEKMEQLLNKYKESVKSLKDRTSQLTTELQMAVNNYDGLVKENEELKITAERLIKAQEEIHTLKESNEDLQNKVNAYDFNKVKEMASLESDLKQAQEEILQLKSKIEVFNKKEEEYAISLAENKLSIHKELENKEAEIKSLKHNLSTSKNEVQSLNIIVNDYKDKLSQMEDNMGKFNLELKELRKNKEKLSLMEKEMKDLKDKCDTQEIASNKHNEEIKCMELQISQERAEKLAMIDRNDYLEGRIKQTLEENIKKSAIITRLEKQLLDCTTVEEASSKTNLENKELLDELNILREKNKSLESEIQDERNELIILQTDIEKLLNNYELTQSENKDLREVVMNLKSENSNMLALETKNKALCKIVHELKNNLRYLRTDWVAMSDKSKILHNTISQDIISFINSEISNIFKTIFMKQEDVNRKYTDVIQQLNKEIDTLNSTTIGLENKLAEVSESNSRLKEEHMQLQKEIKLLTVERDEFKNINDDHNKTIKSCLEENDILKKQTFEVSNNIKDSENTFTSLKQSYSRLEDDNKVLHEKCERLKQEKEMHYENLLMSEQKCQEYEISVKNIQDKVIDRDSLETKLHELNVKYEELEKINKILQDRSIEVEANISKNVSDLLQSKDAVASAVKNSDILSRNNADLQEKLSTLQLEYDSLKEEKSRLHSEIDGLQTHLQKVSKDNTALNDQLRETIANTESSPTEKKLEEIALPSQEINELKNELQEEKLKLADLLRENTVLAEKNLELQDCIKSQHLNIDTINNKNAQSSSHKELEIIELQEKYNSLLQIKLELESKLAEIELLGRSGNKNMQQLHERNEKLKLSNEKLERRLDEALVSLRHFRALEESTELEYLRNILYEYLTGSGTHAETLAKVLAAVVKFDEKQTQAVLQKEKERQGLVG